MLSYSLYCNCFEKGIFCVDERMQETEFAKGFSSQFGVEELDRPAQSHDLNLFNAFGMNWNADCEPDRLASV